MTPITSENKDTGIVDLAELNNQINSKDSKFSLATCKTSPLLKDIKSFSYGGTSSRFQMLRKHINSTNILHIRSQPFKSWECLTISLETNDLDIVVPNQKCMDMLLKLLIYRTETYDGMRNSSKELVEKIVKQKLMERNIHYSKYS